MVSWWRARIWLSRGSVLSREYFSSSFYYCEHCLIGLKWRSLTFFAVAFWHCQVLLGFLYVVWYSLFQYFNNCYIFYLFSKDTVTWSEFWLYTIYEAAGGCHLFACSCMLHVQLMHVLLLAWHFIVYYIDQLCMVLVLHHNSQAAELFIHRVPVNIFQL